MASVDDTKPCLGASGEIYDIDTKPCLEASDEIYDIDTKPCLEASDEIYDIVCGPCKTDNVNKEAKHYCQQCQEHLCDACQDTHRKLKATKNHNILSGRHMPSIKERDSVSYEPTSSKVVLGMKIQSSIQHNVRDDDDNKTPYISGCSFMLSGYLVLCDHDNSKLKLLHRTFRVKDSLSLSAPPWSVSVIDKSNVIVTLPESKQLQYVKLVPHMKAGRVIQLDEKCWGVAVADNEIYVSWYNDIGQGEVRVLDLSGNLKRQLGFPYQFRGAQYLNVSGTGKKIFVSDSSTQTITCMTPDGNVIYQYMAMDLSPGASFVDAGDNIFVCGFGSNNVQVITADGRKYGTLISAKHGIRHPVSIAFREYDKTLIVGCYSNDKILCYKLSQ